MNILVYVTILLVLLLTILFAVLSARQRSFPLRSIQAYSVMPSRVGEAVESDKALHLSFGSSAVRDSTTVSAIATSAILYHLAERAALGDRSPLVTLSDPVTLGLGQDTLRQAYRARSALRKYRTTMARWYPQGPMSLAFAAGVGSAMYDENILTNVLIGNFGSELMLMGESAIRANQSVIAQSDQVAGQAVAYVISDTLLIGEELYVGAAYLDSTPLTIGGVVTQDLLRYLVIFILIGMAILSILGINQ